MLWGGFFGFLLLYAVMGQFVQRLLARPYAGAVLTYRQEFPFSDCHQPVRMKAATVPPSPWPLFSWAVASRATHSAGRVVGRLDPLVTELEWPLPRGQYEVELRLQLSDALGLSQWRSTHKHTTSVTVHSRTTVLPAPRPPSFRTARSGPRSSPRREGEAFDVRLYHPGDDTRRLHWALWAHSGQAWLRIPDLSPPPAGRKVWVVDTSMPKTLAPEVAEEALDARLEPLTRWILASPSWLLVIPALGVSCREPKELASVLAGTHVSPGDWAPADMGWAQGLSETILVLTGPHCPGAMALQRALEPRHRVLLVSLPLPGPRTERPQKWWARR